MSDRVVLFNTNLLAQELEEVVEWHRLGVYLGLSEKEIREIELNHQELARRRTAMLDKWTRKQAHASWEMVIEALEKMSELRLANKLREKYCGTQQDDEKPIAVSTISELEGLVADPQEAGRVITVDYRRHAVAREIDNLRDKYFKLVKKTESAVESANPSSRDLKRFSNFYMTNKVTSVEELFDHLDPYFLNYALLEKIVNEFLLEREHSVVREVNDYIRQLEEFKSSITLKQFMESIETAQRPLTTTETPRICTVTLKLVNGWLEKTISDLDKLLKVLFQDKTSVLSHLRISPGSVIITYLTPLSDVNGLIMIAQEQVPFMLQVGVCELMIGDTVVTSTQSDTSGISFESSLIEAVKGNNINVLSFLLDINTSPDAADDKEWTALMCGSLIAREEAVILLLKANANPNLQTDIGLTPLHAASSNGHSDIVSMLLKANADPNCKTDIGLTPLYAASSNGYSDVVSMLLKAIADPNLQTDIGLTPLYAASSNGHFDVVGMLLKANADPNLKTDIGLTPLHAASNNGHSNVVSMLLKANADPNLQTDTGLTPLYAASSNGHSDVMSMLLKANADPNLKTNIGLTPLHAASNNGHSDVVSMLLKANADPNLQTDIGLTPLYAASSNGHSDVVSMLLKANADPNLKTDVGATPLYAASNSGHSNVVSMLLKANANPNLKTDIGATPLYVASSNGHSDVVSMLLKANADPNLKTSDIGATPLYAASNSGHSNVVSMLLKANGDPNLKTDIGATPLHVASSHGHSDVASMLLKATADPNLQTDIGLTPLHTASGMGHTDIADLLLKANANPNVGAKDTATPLMFACFKGHLQIVQLLLTSGADPNLQHSSGCTALKCVCACHVGCLETVELLLMYGADPSLQTPDRLTALDVAASNGHEDIVDLIHAVELSQSSSTSPVLTVSEIAANVDNEAMSILNKAIEKILIEKTDSFISSQYKMLDKSLPSKNIVIDSVR